MSSENLRRTALYQTHVDLGARIVPFAGWEMPLEYSGILDETKAVRSRAGIFDVSHMGRLYISGSDAASLLDWVVTAGAANLRLGRARYAMICNEAGGIIDDTVFYRLDSEKFLLVCNAGNRDEVVLWLDRWVQERFGGASVDDRTLSTAMIAFQGPAAAASLDRLCDGSASPLMPFGSTEGEVASRPVLIGRTGYTGEDGFELMVDASDAAGIWNALVEAGGAPCGLGARDVLRLEAGLALHGHDITPESTPIEAGLGRYVKLDKEFVGAQVLRQQSADGPESRLVGLVVEGRRIPREGYGVYGGGEEVGRVTSGSISPSLDRNIALAYVLEGFSTLGQQVQIDIRGQMADGVVTQLPFYSRKGGG
ncbi:MAG: glycine cleavage system aminomethyltransferase GcvT [Dehalococcoidia bacterium]|nr:glycine cleavage system aminomethyltransferase GcvT [Dehalococcoidia bacterium]